MEPGTWNFERRKSVGLSLIELIVFIVIVSAAVAGVLGALGLATRSSADPMIHKQALAIAEAVMEEVQLMPFTYCDPDDPSAATVDAAGAPIAFDAASSADSGGSAVTSLTWSHTVTSTGSDRILIVGVSIRDVSPMTTVSSVTYAGASLTRIAQEAPSTASPVAELWYKVNPATGANNITVTLSASQGVVGGATSWTGVHQTTPLGTAATANGTSTSPSVNVSSAPGEVVVDVLAAKESDGQNQIATVGAGQTPRWNLKTTVAGARDVLGAGSHEDGATTVTMSWSLSVSHTWAIVGVSLKPAGGCATLAEAIGPEAGETRYSSTVPFDNVNDYHGFDSNTAVPSGIRNIDGTLIDGLDGYRVTVSVASQALGAIPASDSLLITVTVTGPGNTTATVHGYRVRYAPNALP